MQSRRPVITCLVAMIILCAVVPSQSVLAASWLDRLKEVLGSEDSSGVETTGRTLSTADVSGGLKEALLIGTERVVGRLGRTDGFNLDPEVRIPLPEELEMVKSVLARVGMDATLTDLEVRLNRAAELAVPQAQELFVDAIGEMTLDDVQSIYRGPDNAATAYFQSKMSAPLARQMVPVVQQSLADAGVVQAYTAVMAQYNAVPFVPKVDADLSAYVVDRGVHGIFHYLAQEEAAIRQDPAKRTTELLRRVFTDGD